MIRATCSISLLAAAVLSSPVHAGIISTPLIGIHNSTGDVYTIDSSSAVATLVGSTGIGGIGSLEFGPDGSLYGFTTGGAPSPTLYRIDPVTYAATAIGGLGVGFVFEGALTFAPDGRVFGTNQDSSGVPRLFTLDLTTGLATLVGTISGGSHDINGLAWRPSDGMLIGIDRLTNSVLTIDPTTAASSVLATIGGTVGGVGGLTVFDGTGYFVTSGPGGTRAGSNELRTLDLTTGANASVGSLFPTITGNGLSGLAVVPEPATMLLLFVGAVAVVRPRRK